MRPARFHTGKVHATRHDQKPCRLHVTRIGADAPPGRGAQDETASSRYARGHPVRIAAQARPVRGGLRQRTGRTPRGRRAGHAACHVRAQCRARQWHGGARRRDRRLALKSPSHLGCAVVPAAWAVGERHRQNGQAVLNAIALGYDVGARSTWRSAMARPRARNTALTASPRRSAPPRLPPPSPVSIRSRCVFALSYTAQQASGIPSWNRDHEHIEKAFDFGGMGARNGVFAALIVKAGATAVPDPLTGHHSFLHAFADKADESVLTDGLGGRFEVMEASIKKWCVGSPIQAALDSLAFLLDEHSLKAADVKRLTVTMPDDRLHIVSNREIPDICLQHLARGDAGGRHAHLRQFARRGAHAATRQILASARADDRRPIRGTDSGQAGTPGHRRARTWPMAVQSRSAPMPYAARRKIR